MDIVDLSILLSNWGPCPYNRVEPTTAAVQLDAATTPASFTTNAASLSTQAQEPPAPTGGPSRF